MRPLNRPMFKMGGPVKEGIMDGIREPKANGGTIGGGTIVGEDKGKGRTGFVDPRLLALQAAYRGIPTLIKRSPGFLKDLGKSVFTRADKAGLAPRGTKPDFFSFQGIRNLFPTQRFRNVTVPAAQKDAAQFISGQTYQPARLTLREAFTDPKIIGQAIRENPFTTFLGAGQIKNVKGIVEGDEELLLGKVRNLGVDAVQGAANYLLGTEFGKEKADLNVKQKGNTVGQRGPDTINQTTEKGNQFNDDGSKKETSVSRLLKAVEKRSRDAAVADSLIAAGEEIRTGGIDSDTVGNITQRVSKEFDKDVDLRQKLDLARIESELKKEQIAAQAIATDPVNIEIRKRKLTTIGDLDRADRGGVRYGVKGGIRLLAQDFEQLTGVQFQGSLGGDDELKRIADTEAFKLNPESVIKDSIENIKTSDGNIIVGENGTYMLGNQLYEYTNGVVKRLK